MTRDTFVVLKRLEQLSAAIAHVQTLPDGVYPLPDHILDLDASEDLAEVIHDLQRHREIYSGIEEDPELRDGQVLVKSRGGRRPRLRMTHDTFLALMHNNQMGELREHTGSLPSGLYVLPPRITDYDAAENLRHSIEHVGPGQAECCVQAGCLQTVVSIERGFPVCEHHDALLQGWDDALKEPSP